MSDGSTLPGGPLQTGEAVDGSEGEGEGDDVGDENQGGQGGLEVGLSPPGSEQGDGTGGDGWEISNELPDPQGGQMPGDEGGDGELANLPDAGAQGGVGEDEELERTLGGLDGSILSERNSEIQKANDRAVASGLPDLSDEGLGTGDAQGGTASVSEGSATAPNEVNVQPQDREGGQATPVIRTAVDTPDARDEDVIARQLREAALAEEDPELRASLWEEWERYTGQKK